MPESSQAYTVSAITRRIKSSLEDQFTSIWVEGEISNYHHHTSGHRYITLKDASAVIKVVIWKSAGQYLKFEPENGQKVLAFGDVTVYERGGNYQLSCRRLQPLGVGALEIAFRQLHDKLLGEGLFDEDRKQEMPVYPSRIGVVTSPTSAALRDIIQIAGRRNDSVELIVFPAQVQGEGAEDTIVAGIEYFNSRQDIDLIVTGRGGGSLEDLWPFNTEKVVRAIAESSLPIVTGVGHEIDTTLADLAADVRAATPSAAAEIVVWPLEEFKARLQRNLLSQANQIRSLVSQARNQLYAFLKRGVYSRPHNMVQQRRQYLDSLIRLIASGGKNSFEGHKNRLSLTLAKLEALSPLKILARGYSVTQSEKSGRVVKNISQVSPGERLAITVMDGRIVSIVDSAAKRE